MLVSVRQDVPVDGFRLKSTSRPLSGRNNSTRLFLPAGCSLAMASRLRSNRSSLINCPPLPLRRCLMHSQRHDVSARQQDYLSSSS
jgi:hypothetical protein